LIKYASYDFERAHVIKLGPWDLSQLGALPPPSENTFLDTYTIDSGIILYLRYTSQLFNYFFPPQQLLRIHLLGMKVFTKTQRDIA